MALTCGRSIILGAGSGVTERTTVRSVAEASPSASSHNPPVNATKETETSATEAIPNSIRPRGLRYMSRRGAWSPRARRRDAAAARRASDSGSEAEGLPRFLAAVAGRRLLLLPPPVMGKLHGDLSVPAADRECLECVCGVWFTHFLKLSASLMRWSNKSGLRQSRPGRTALNSPAPLNFRASSCA
jgi:hypothetical protein